MKLFLWIGGYGGPCFTVESEDGRTVRYTRSQSGAPGTESIEDITPTEAQWKRFWLVAQECTDWDAKYMCEFALDGTQWEVEIENGDLRVQSGGSNDFPENWKKFERAVRQLIGGRDFE